MAKIYNQSERSTNAHSIFCVDLFFQFIAFSGDHRHHLYFINTIEAIHSIVPKSFLITGKNGVSSELLRLFFRLEFREIFFIIFNPKFPLAIANRKCRLNGKRVRVCDVCVYALRARDKISGSNVSVPVVTCVRLPKHKKDTTHITKTVHS